jgi:hypothetical protein
VFATIGKYQGMAMLQQERRLALLAVNYESVTKL